MKDREPLGNKRDKMSRFDIPSNITHEQLINILQTGVYHDLVNNNDVGNGGPQEKGTPYSKAAVLPNNAEVALNLPENSTPADAFMSLAGAYARITRDGASSQNITNTNQIVKFSTFEEKGNIFTADTNGIKCNFKGEIYAKTALNGIPQGGFTVANNLFVYIMTPMVVAAGLTRTDSSGIFTDPKCSRIIRVLPGDVISVGVSVQNIASIPLGNSPNTVLEVIKI